MVINMTECVPLMTDNIAFSLRKHDNNLTVLSVLMIISKTCHHACSPVLQSANDLKWKLGNYTQTYRHKLIFKNPLWHLSWVEDMTAKRGWHLLINMKQECQRGQMKYLHASKKKISWIGVIIFLSVLEKRLGHHQDVFIRVFGLYLSSAGVRERFHYGGSVGL